MIRYIVCGVVLCLCISLQMGWKELAAMYHLNYHIDYNHKDSPSTVEGEIGSTRDHLYWTDIYAPHDTTVDSSLLDASTITAIDHLVASEASILVDTSSWNLVHNYTEYTVESRAVKSNSMSIMENPIIRLRMAPLPCHSAQHLLQGVIHPPSLMATFFPLFHLYESKAAAAAESSAPEEVDSPCAGETEAEGTAAAEVTAAAAAEGTAAAAAEGTAAAAAERGEKISTSTTAELSTVIAPLIWPFEERHVIQ